MEVEWNNTRDMIIKGQIMRDDFPYQHNIRYHITHDATPYCSWLKQWVQNQSSDKFWFGYNNQMGKCSAWMAPKRFNVPPDGLGPVA